MKIHASGFDLDMNAMLNQINGQNGLDNANAIIKKAWKDTQQKYDDATKHIQNVYKQAQKDLEDRSGKDINYVNVQNDAMRKRIVDAHDDIKSFIDDQKFITPQKLDNDYNQLWGHITFRGQTVNGPKDMANAIWAEDKYIAEQMSKQAHAEQQFVNEQINNTMSKPVKEQFDNLRNDLPHNFMSYMQPGQYPPNATAGDICWQAPKYGFNTNAKAYQYDGTSWKPLKTELNLYASNIYSPNINGGNITGAQFLSEYHGRDGQARFSVDTNGDIYAHNLFMDLETYTTGSGVNGYTYNANTNESKGLNFNHGVMTMKAIANQTSGTFVRGYNGAAGGSNDADYAGDFNAYTYLQPDYLKLRSGTLGGELLARTDIRGGNIELADQWGQNWGVRLGYWNEDSSNKSVGDVGPLLAIENGVKLGYGANDRAELHLDDWNFHESGAGKLWIENQYNQGEIDLNAPTNISGELKVENDTVVKGKHYAADQRRIGNSFDHHQQELDHHNSWLTNHNQRLDSHKSRLDGDDTKLSQHDAKLNDLKNNINNNYYKQESIIGQNGSAIQATQNQISQYESEVTGFNNSLNNLKHDTQNQINNKVSTIDSEFEGQFLSQTSYYSDKQNQDNDIGYLRSEIQNLPNSDADIGNVKADISNIKTTVQDNSVALHDNCIWSSNNGDGSIYFHQYFQSGPTVAIHAGDVISHGQNLSSDLSLKKDITPVNSHAALSKVLNIDIKAWRYKEDREDKPCHIGPIIDDLNSNKHQNYYTPNELIHTDEKGNHSLSLNNSISFLILSVKELQKQNSELSQRVAKLEINQKR